MIFELRGQVMVLYGLPYLKNMNFLLKSHKLKLTPPDRFFDAYPVLKINVSDPV